MRDAESPSSLTRLSQSTEGIFWREKQYRNANATQDVRQLLTPIAQWQHNTYSVWRKVPKLCVKTHSSTSVLPQSLGHGFILPTSTSSENKSQLAFFQYLKLSSLESLQTRAEDPQNAATLTRKILALETEASREFWTLPSKWGCSNTSKREFPTCRILPLDQLNRKAALGKAGPTCWQRGPLQRTEQALLVSSAGL